MKRTWFLILLLVVSYDVYSQATPLQISQYNFFPDASIDSVGVITSQYSGDVPVPKPAENEIWNYSNTDFMNTSKQEKFFTGLSENTNSFFEDSQFAYENIFQVIAGDRGFFYNSYINYDQNGLYSVGIGIDEQEFSLADLTADENDRVIFPKQNFQFDQSNYILKLPMTYGDNFSSKYKSIVNFNITVAMLGLEQADVSNISYIERADTVIGWGELMVPSVHPPFVFNSNPYRVLLLKRVEAKLDSFMLFGEPAPFEMLASFGMTQGLKTTKIKYEFWREGGQIPLLRLTVNSVTNFVEQVEYDLNADYTMSVDEDDYSKSNILTYPNPVNNILNVKLEGDKINLDNLKIAIIDLNGQIVSEFSIKDENPSMNLPSNITNGTYFIKVSDSLGKFISKGKFVVNR